MYSVEKVKALAKIRTPESFDTLLEIFRSDENIDVGARLCHQLDDIMTATGYMIF